MVCAVVVVVAEIGLELAAPAAEIGVEVARKGGSPALVEDGLVIEVKRGRS